MEPRQDKIASASKVEKSSRKRKVGNNDSPATKVRRTSPVTLLPSTSAEATVTQSNPNVHKYECQCCYDSVSFENLVQCSDGHLFCEECLKKYVNEAVYGQGNIKLKCMTYNCPETYPESQLLRAVPQDLKQKLEERLWVEIISTADVKNFVRCPSCNVGAVLDEVLVYFVCPNPTCKQVTCRHCQVEIQAHPKQLCTVPVQVANETSLRTEFEEKMCEVKVRQCPKCNVKFLKTGGCNLMHCRCGAKVCYVCREVIQGYDHFCNHVGLQSRAKCPINCNKCLTFTSLRADEERNIRNLKLKAERAMKKNGFSKSSKVGAPTRFQKRRRN